MVRGADLHQDLLRWSVASASNDHRLGGHEAPPAIMSVYTGDYVAAVIDSLINGKPMVAPKQHASIGVDYLPERIADNSDRNRTSPIAFTGNKFELRAVGSSQSTAFSNMVLNVLMADSFSFFADEISKLKQKGVSADQALRNVAVEALKKHQRIIYNGNGYSDEWKAEAKRRGLLNFVTTVDVLAAIPIEANVKLFESLKVFSPREFNAFLTADLESYIATQQLESEAIISLSNRHIIPASVRYQNVLLENSDSVPKALKEQIKGLIESAHTATNKLKNETKLMGNIPVLLDQAKHAVNNVKRCAGDLRIFLDSLEEVVGQEYWPYPTYEEILLTRHKKPNHCHNKE